MLTVGVEEEGDARVTSSHRAICHEQSHGEESIQSAISLQMPLRVLGTAAVNAR